MIAVYLLISIAFVFIPRVVHRAVGVKAKLTWRGPRQLLAIAALTVALFVADRIAGAEAALLVAFLASVILIVLAALRARAFVRLEILCDALGNAEHAETALSQIEGHLTTMWTTPSTWEVTVRQIGPQSLFLIERAIHHGHAARALAWLDRMPPRTLTGDLPAVYTQYRAAALVRVGDTKRAREALREAKRPSSLAGFEEAFLALEALMDAIEGDASTSLARADRALAAPGAPQIHGVWRAVRAHALATSHTDAEIEAVLREIVKVDGPTGLRRLVDHKGPASARAASFLSSEGPYR